VLLFLLKLQKRALFVRELFLRVVHVSHYSFREKARKICCVAKERKKICQSSKKKEKKAEESREKREKKQKEFWNDESFFVQNWCEVSSSCF
jgi:hypothetical protein